MHRPVRDSFTEYFSGLLRVFGSHRLIFAYRPALKKTDSLERDNSKFVYITTYPHRQNNFKNRVVYNPNKSFNKSFKLFKFLAAILNLAVLEPA